MTLAELGELLGLGAKKSKRGRPYLKDHITGKYDKDTAAAFLEYRLVEKDKKPNQPLRQSDAILKKLAQGERFAVLEGTTNVFVTSRTASPGRLSGPELSTLPEPRRTFLQQLLRDLTKEYGVSFDAETEIPNLDNPTLTVRISPKGMTLFDGRRWRQNLQSDMALGRAAQKLLEALKNDLTVRIRKEVVLHTKVDRDLDMRLAGDGLVFIIRSEADGLRRKYQVMLSRGEGAGLTFAAKLLKHYLSAKGSPITITEFEALSLGIVEQAIITNSDRFIETSIAFPKHVNMTYQDILNFAKNPAIPITLSDHWKYDIDHTTWEGLKRIGKSVDLRSLGSAADALSYILGAGRSGILSTGVFDLSVNGGYINVNGFITHEWQDLNYDFNLGSSYKKETKILEDAGYAKSFKWTATWQESLRGRLQLDLQQWPHNLKSGFISPFTWQRTV